ncbi:hypothetical protein [Desulfovibrio psychrotolerans]|uniref:Uncharacterized protein n=1 Tax=Desulfovibrio psychrotolerans TaxID=415242 RepID=A0A7J0BXR2_9BACT|nr:hypothetical protein [Desulfovibrio psychrotolerans]GFM38479.1 hypothetical protein DSM19430T_31630 [Desulfovibrio psychrotolerans]
MSKTPDDNKEMPNYLVRGILIGGAMGTFAHLAGFMDNLPRALALGMVAGFLAGITLAHKHKNRNKK